MLDEKDTAILTLIQQNCKYTARKIAEKINSPITTVFAKIKRMEKMGIIKGYKAVLNHKKLGYGATAFILASVSYERKKETLNIPQRVVAEHIAKFPEVQEVHIISGDWDLLIKVREKNVETVGKFVVDKLRTVEGIERTLTCMVFDTEKETTDIVVPKKI